MAANRILLVEDDHAIADAVALNLRTVGYEVVAFDDGGQPRPWRMTIPLTSRCWTLCCRGWMASSSLR